MEGISEVRVTEGDELSKVTRGHRGDAEQQEPLRFYFGLGLKKWITTDKDRKADVNRQLE